MPQQRGCATAGAARPGARLRPGARRFALGRGGWRAVFRPTIRPVQDGAQRRARAPRTANGRALFRAWSY
jgi:hypothetical protein